MEYCPPSPPPPHTHTSSAGGPGPLKDLAKVNINLHTILQLSSFYQSSFAPLPSLRNSIIKRYIIIMVTYFNNQSHVMVT